MKKAQIVVGGIYAAKVGGKIRPVRILAVSELGGWDVVNVETNRAIRVKSPQRLRFACDQHCRPLAGRIVAGEKQPARGTNADGWWQTPYDEITGELRQSARR